jgi:hypothetical protein
MLRLCRPGNDADALFQLPVMKNALIFTLLLLKSMVALAQIFHIFVPKFITNGKKTSPI